MEDKDKALVGIDNTLLALLSAKNVILEAQNKELTEQNARLRGKQKPPEANLLC
jgi:hypothetical protein